MQLLTQEEAEEEEEGVHAGGGLRLCLTWSADGTTSMQVLPPCACCLPVPAAALPTWRPHAVCTRNARAQLQHESACALAQAIVQVWGSCDV